MITDVGRLLRLYTEQISTSCPLHEITNFVFGLKVSIERHNEWMFDSTRNPCLSLNVLITALALEDGFQGINIRCNKHIKSA